jgi:hypothetical protein
MSDRPLQLVALSPREEDLPPIEALGARLAPSLMVGDDPEDDDLGIEYTLDREDAALALFLYRRRAMPGDDDASAGVDGTPPGIVAFGLPGRVERTRIEDRHEIMLRLRGGELVLGLFITSTEAEAAERVLDVALDDLLPLVAAPRS